MDKKTIPIITFMGEKEKQGLWSGKFTAGSEIKEYHVLRTDAKKVSDDDADETREK